MKKISFENKLNKDLFITGTALAIFATFFLGHIDCQWITYWGYDLLDSLFHGKMSNFPEYTYSHCSMPTNYTLFTNVITAVWLNPMYIIESILGTDFGILAFELYYKIFVLIINILNLYLFNALMNDSNIKSCKREIGLILYEFSAITWLAVLAKGQVDNVVVLFTLIAFRELKRERILRAGLLFGLAALIKPFVLLVAIPIMLLLLGKHVAKSIFSLILLAVPYIFDKTITALIMPEYGKYSALTSEMFKETFGKSRVEEIFSAKLGTVTVFLSVVLILMFIAYYLGIHKKAEYKHFLIIPALTMISYGLFVSATCYWFICILPMLIFMCLSYEKLSDGVLLQLGLSISCIGLIYTSEKANAPALKNGLLGFVGLARNNFDISVFLGNINGYAIKLFRDGFTICMLLMVLLYIYENHKKEVQNNARN